MTGLVIEEINEIKKIVNFTVCYYIGVINDEKKDEVLALIQALTSNHISILLNPINITDYLTDLFSNNEIMAILIYFHKNLSFTAPKKSFKVHYIINLSDTKGPIQKPGPARHGS